MYVFKKYLIWGYSDHVFGGDFYFIVDGSQVYNKDKCGRMVPSKLREVANKILTKELTLRRAAVIYE